MTDMHRHTFGPIAYSRITGTPSRKCQDCRTITLDLADDMPAGERRILEARYARVMATITDLVSDVRAFVPKSLADEATALERALGLEGGQE